MAWLADGLGRLVRGSWAGGGAALRGGGVFRWRGGGVLRGAWLWRAFVEEAFEPEVVDARLRDDGPFANFDADDVHAFAALRALGHPRFDGFVFMRKERAEPLVAGLRGGGVKAAVPDSHEPAGQDVL